MAHRRRRTPVRTPQKRRSARSNRNPTGFVVLAIVMVFALLATVIGPPLIDYLTSPDEPDVLSLDNNGEDPVEADYRERIEQNPQDADAMGGLASYLGNTGRVEDAIAWYERALEIAPEEWDIRLGFARTLANGGKRPDAELQFNRVIEARPTDAQAYFSLGRLYLSWIPPRTEDAVSAFRTVIDIGPDTLVAELAAEELASLGVGTPIAASPVASPVTLETNQ